MFFRIFIVLWRSLIKKNGGVVGPTLDVSSLAKITDGYTPGQMATACQQVCAYFIVNSIKIG